MRDSFALEVSQVAGERAKRLRAATLGCAALLALACAWGCAALPVSQSISPPGVFYAQPLSLHRAGSVGPRLQALVHVSGSRGFAFGPDAGMLIGGHCADASGLSLGAAGGYSLMPLPDESRAGGELFALFGGGGPWRDKNCLRGLYTGARIGVPLRLSASQPAFELNRNKDGTFYLVPQIELIRYLGSTPGSDPTKGFSFTVTLSVRYFLWSRMEP